MQLRTELRERGSTRSNRKYFKGAIVTHKHGLQKHTQRQPRFTAHVRPRSTVPQPDGISWESILLRQENRSTRKKPLGDRLRSTNLSSHAEPGTRSRIVEVRGATDDRYAILKSLKTALNPFSCNLSNLCLSDDLMKCHAKE